LARDLAETLGGEVRLAYSDERGSEFVLSLPLPAEPLAAPLTEKESDRISGLPPVMAGSTGLSLLIVEDNQALRTYQKKRFGGKFNVLTAANGEEALNLVGENPPDVIISDVVMPKMNGFQLCLQLKSEVTTSHIPFFLLTGQDSKEHKREGFAAGADDYITKPVDFDILSAKIDNLLLTRAAFQKTFSEAEEGAVFQRLSNELDQQFLDDITQVVEDNISDAELTVNFLCQSVRMSRTPFYHKLKTLIDLTPSEFIRTIRLKRARQMLLRPGINISEVAYSTGFSDAKYFSTLFKKNFGVSPSGFIADHLKTGK
jgi:YesN/AraC family two-component response regulator